MGDLALDGDGERGQLGVADHAAELPLGLEHPGGGPAQAHVAVLPTLDVAAGPADALEHRLARVGIPYETARMLPVTPDRLDVLDVRAGEYGATVRDRGIREQTRSGRPVLFDGLRARVSRWPPLRL